MVQPHDERVAELEAEAAVLRRRLAELEPLARQAEDGPRQSGLGRRQTSGSPRANQPGWLPLPFATHFPGSWRVQEAVVALMRDRADTAADAALAQLLSDAPSPSASASATPPPPPSAAAEGVALKDDPRFALYFKMLNVGLPKDAVRQRMVNDKQDPAVLDLDPALPLPASLPSAGGPPVAVKDDPRFLPYFKMLAVGVPRFAVEQKMRSKGLDPDVLVCQNVCCGGLTRAPQDMDPNAPAPQPAPQPADAPAGLSIKKVTSPPPAASPAPTDALALRPRSGCRTSSGRSCTGRSSPRRPPSRCGAAPRTLTSSPVRRGPPIPARRGT
jgi:hypothetical protein